MNKTGSIYTNTILTLKNKF